MTTSPIEVANSAAQPTRPQPKDRVFFVLWVVAFTFGIMAGSNISPQMGNWFGGPLGEWLTHFVVALFLLEVPRDLFNLILYLAAHTVAGLFAGLTGGFIDGLSQWLVLRRRIPGLIGWFLFTFIANGLLNALISLMGSALSLAQLGPLIQLAYLFFVEAPLSGLVIGAGQWLLLRKKLKNSILWIFVPWLSMIIDNFLIIAVSLFKLPLRVDSEQWIVGDLIILALAILFGLLSGAVLTWLMSKDQRYAKFVQPE